MKQTIETTIPADWEKLVYESLMRRDIKERTLFEALNAAVLSFRAKRYYAGIMGPKKEPDQLSMWK